MYFLNLSTELIFVLALNLNFLYNYRPAWDINHFSLTNRNRKSAFLPYKPSSTVLTNLQRGNTEATIDSEVCLSFHERCGQGEITADQARQETFIDALDGSSYTPLHWACFYGQLNSAQILVNFGADVNKLAPDRVSPLVLAASGGHHEVVRFLLQHGADPHHMDIVLRRRIIFKFEILILICLQIGNTALMYAAAGNHPHTCNELLAYNIKLTTSNENGDTAYSLAVQNNSHLAQAVLDNFIISIFMS